MKSWKRKCRSASAMKRRSLKVILCFAGLLAVALILCIRKQPELSNDTVTIQKYRNLRINVSRQPDVTLEEAAEAAKQLENETGLRIPAENIGEYMRNVLLEEQKYELEMQKRQGILRELLKNTSFHTEVEDKEEAVLGAIYEEEKLFLTETEKQKGIDMLKDVFGADTKEELSGYLSEEEQLKIIEKEKTYEYLLKNNRFIAAADTGVFGRVSGGGTGGIR